MHEPICRAHSSLPSEFKRSAIALDLLFEDLSCTSRSDNSLGLLLGSLEFNSSAVLTTNQLVHLQPVTIPITTIISIVLSSSTLIDVIMTSSIDLVERCDVLKSHISDHYLVYAFLKLKISKPPPSYVKVRSYKNYDNQCFVSDLERVPWNEVLLVDDASDMVDRFNKRFLEVLDGHAPVKSVKVKHRHCPFVNEEIKELMRNRDRLLKRARCSGLPVDWELYRDSRQVVKFRLRKAEQEYINKEMEGCQNTSSQWKLIRNCLPRKEATQQVYTREVKAVAEEFNEFFVSVGAKASEASKALIATHELSPPNDFTSGQIYSG